MPDAFSFKITGGAELARQLQDKPPIVARQIIRSSLRAAVVPWREEMAARVRKGWHVFSSAGQARGLRRGPGTPRFTGERRGVANRQRDYAVIARNIRVSSSVDSGGFAGSAAVYPAPRAFWARFLEHGFRHLRDKQVGPFPFIVPAFETRKGQVLDAFIGDVKKQLEEGFGK